jgi:hypothetical protein
LVSALHCPRPRIGSLDRLTRTSTRGSSSRSFGDCALTAPLDLALPFPCRVLRGHPIPASVGTGHRSGPRAADPPTGGSSWDASARQPRPPSPSGDMGRTRLVGGWCFPTPYASRHGDPGPPSGFGRTMDRGLRSATPGPLRRFLPSHPIVRSWSRDRSRSFPPPRPGRQVDVTGLASAGPLAPTYASVRLGPNRLRPATPLAFNDRRLDAPCPRAAPPGATSVALDCCTPAWKIGGP